METLEEEFKNDPDALDFYKRKLIIPGWAGELTDNEADWLSRLMKTDKSVRRAWRRALKETNYPKRRRKFPSAAVLMDWNEHFSNNLSILEP